MKLVPAKLLDQRRINAGSSPGFRRRATSVAELPPGCNQSGRSPMGPSIGICQVRSCVLSYDPALYFSLIATLEVNGVDSYA